MGCGIHPPLRIPDAQTMPTPAFHYPFAPSYPSHPFHPSHPPDETILVYTVPLSRRSGATRIRRKRSVGCTSPPPPLPTQPPKIRCVQQGEGVDIERHGDIVNVAWTATEEWISYTVENKAGTIIQDVALLYATVGGSNGLALAIDLADPSGCSKLQTGDEKVICPLRGGLGGGTGGGEGVRGRREGVSAYTKGHVLVGGEGAGGRHVASLRYVQVGEGDVHVRGTHGYYDHGIKALMVSSAT